MIDHALRPLPLTRKPPKVPVQLPLLISLLISTSAFAQPLLIQSVSIVDVTTGEILPGRFVTIKNERIIEIDSDADPSPDTTTIDGSGMFLIPGLWDMHTHTILRDGANSTFDQSTMEVIPEIFLPVYVANGVTGIRDMHCDLDRGKRLRTRIARNDIIAPRLVYPGPIVDGPSPTWPDSISIASPEEARNTVRMLKENGADFVKVYTGLSEEVYRALAEEAKRLEIPFAGHVPRSITPSEASDAGQASLEHMYGIAVTPELLEAMRRNQTRMVPTLVLYEAYTIHNPETTPIGQPLRFIPQGLQDWWTTRFASQYGRRSERTQERFQRLLSKIKEDVNRMNAAGITILAGTDCTNPYVYPGFSLHDELRLLVEAGLTPVEALRAATLGPAQFLGLETDTGTIQKGKRADLILLRQNPLDDIRNTTKIEAVVLRGKLIARADLDRILEESAKKATNAITQQN